jgi:hypothetical protein
MSNNHSMTKRNRRPKAKDRRDYTAETLAKLKVLESAAIDREAEDRELAEASEDPEDQV